MTASAVLAGGRDGGRPAERAGRRAPASEVALKSSGVCTTIPGGLFSIRPTLNHQIS